MSAGATTMVMALLGPAIVGCCAAVGPSSAVMQQSAVGLFVAACCLHEVHEVHEYLYSDNEISVADLLIEQADDALRRTMSEAIVASRASASNTIFEVQLVADAADTAANNLPAQSIDSSDPDKRHKHLPASRAEQGPAPGVTQTTVDLVEAEVDLKPASADSADSSPALSSLADAQAEPALKLAQEKEAEQEPEGSWAAHALKNALCRAEWAELALEEQQLTLTGSLQEAEQALKVSKSKAEAAQQALVKEQEKAETFFCDIAEAASKDARVAHVKQEQAEAAVMKLQSEKAEAEEAAQAAARRAEVAEAALHRYQKLDHRVAKLQRALRKWPALHLQGEYQFAVPSQHTLPQTSCAAWLCPVWLCPVWLCPVLLQTGIVHVS